MSEATSASELVSRYHCVPGQKPSATSRACNFLNFSSFSILLRVIVAQNYQLALPCGVFPVRRRKAGRLYFPYFGYVIVAEN